MRPSDMGEPPPRTAEGHRLLCALKINPLNVRHPTINASQVQAVWPELAAASQRLRLFVELEGQSEVHSVTAHPNIASGGRSFHLSLPSRHRRRQHARAPLPSRLPPRFMLLSHHVH